MTPSTREASKLTKDEWREYTKTVWHIANVTHPSHPAVFPPEIPRRLIKLFSFVGETVLDPFAGVGTTAKAAVALDRRAISIEQNPDYADLVRRDVAASDRSQVHVADSRRMDFIADESIDLIVTSPPYWNKADYGPGKANLGNIGSYPGFFEEMRPVFDECFRVLRPGRKLGVVMLREIGFLLINELVWSKDRTGGRWGSAGIQRPIFGSYPYPPNFLFKNVHEYILVFAKPPHKVTTGPKVVSYRELMTKTEAVGAGPVGHDNGNGRRRRKQGGNGVFER